MKKYLESGHKLRGGFRMTYADELQVRESCPDGIGKLVVDLLNTDSLERIKGLQAILSGFRVRVVDQSFQADPTVDYVVEVVSIHNRMRGERV